MFSLSLSADTKRNIKTLWWESSPGSFFCFSACVGLKLNLLLTTGIFPLVHFILLFTFTTGPSLCTRVQQVPSSILGSIHGETRISCNHSESTYNVILWYQKPRGDSALKLIGYILYGNPTIEDGFQESFKISGDGSVKSQLEVEKLKAEDSGSYYCAASIHSELVNVLLLQKPYMILRHINK